MVAEDLSAPFRILRLDSEIKLSWQPGLELFSEPAVAEVWKHLLRHIDGQLYHCQVTVYILFDPPVLHFDRNKLACGSQSSFMHLAEGGRSDGSLVKRLKQVLQLAATLLFNDELDIFKAACWSPHAHRLESLDVLRRYKSLQLAEHLAQLDIGALICHEHVVHAPSRVVVRLRRDVVTGVQVV